MAATGSLESSVLRLEGIARDFSENNLADHMSSRLDYQGYAPSELAAAYYARWEGPVYESADPYPAPGRSPEFLRAVRHVQEVLFLPQRAPGAQDNAAVKWAVSTYGGVDAAIDFDTERAVRILGSGRRARTTTARVPIWTTTSSAWGGTTRTRRGTSPRRRRATAPSSCKNSWGTGFGDAGLLLALVLRRELRQGARGVRRRREGERPRRRVPVRRARPQRVDPGRRHRERLVRQPVLVRRDRRRDRGLVLHPRARHELRGPRGRHAAGGRRGRARRLRHDRGGRLPHGGPAAAGEGDGRRQLRRRRACHHAGVGRPGARRGAVGVHRPARRGRAVLRERRRRVVDRPHA